MRVVFVSVNHWSEVANGLSSRQQDKLEKDRMQNRSGEPQIPILTSKPLLHPAPKAHSLHHSPHICGSQSDNHTSSTTVPIPDKYKYQNGNDLWREWRINIWVEDGR